MNDSERRMAEFKRKVAQQQAKMRRDADRQRQQSERLRKANELKAREQKQQSEKFRRESERRQEKAKEETQRRQDRAEADANRREDRRRQEHWRKEDRADKELLERERRFERTSSYREPTTSAGNGPYSDHHKSGSGCLKLLVLLMALTSLLWWQRETVVPDASLAWARFKQIVHDAKPSPTRVETQKDTLGSNHKDERRKAKSKISRDQSDLLKVKSKPQHGETTTLSSLSFTDMIQNAEIKRAVYGSLTGGKPTKWEQDDKTGYAVASVIVERKGHDCRSIYISERDGSEDRFTNTVIYCRTGDEWYAS